MEEQIKIAQNLTILKCQQTPNAFQYFTNILLVISKM